MDIAAVQQQLWDDARDAWSARTRHSVSRETGQPQPATEAQSAPRATRRGKVALAEAAPYLHAQSPLNTSGLAENSSDRKTSGQDFWWNIFRATLD